MFKKKKTEARRHRTQIFWPQSVSQSDSLLESSELIETLGLVKGLHELTSQAASLAYFISKLKAAWDLGQRSYVFALSKKTQSEDIQVPAVELCWSHSTPKDCLLNLGTDTNRDLFPLALHSTTGSKLEPSHHISWVKCPSWRYTLRRKERGSFSPPFAHSENTWDLRRATDEEIKDCPSCCEHEIMCFMSVNQSRKRYWEVQ